jgi:hypothetical protein
MPAKTLGIMCERSPSGRSDSGLRRALVSRIGLMFCTPTTMVPMMGNMPWLRPKAIFEAGPMPVEEQM